MNMMTAIKLIHKTLREAGYARHRSVYEVGSKVYRTSFDFHHGRFSVVIQGNWSIPMRSQIVKDLKKTLEAFSPMDDFGVIGVQIDLTRIDKDQRQKLLRLAGRVKAGKVRLT